MMLGSDILISLLCCSVTQETVVGDRAERLKEQLEVAVS